MELVTAVITTHKREPEIVERALKSILTQTYKNIEVIVVDDSPVDYVLRNAVKDTVEKYKEQNVIYIQHESCQGACAARNTGLKLSKGKFIGYLDDDDEWKPKKIEKQLAAFTNENIALVCCGAEEISEDTNISKFRKIEPYSGKVFDKLILSNFIGSTSFPLIKKDCLLEIGGFDVLMKSAQDYDVWLRLAEKYEINYVEDSLVIYHIHKGEQISKNYQRRIAGLERLNEKNKEYFRKNGYAYWFRTIKMAPEYARNNQKGKAWKSWFKAVLKRPFKIKTNLQYLYGMFRAFNGKN